MRLRRVAVIAVMVWGLTPTSSYAAPDLASLAPGADDACAAVSALSEKGKEAMIPSHALPLTGDDHPSDIRPLMTEAAWAEANAITTRISAYQDFDVQRLELPHEKAKGWVFSVVTGQLRNPVLWVFSSTADGQHASHLITVLGGEGSGPFDTYFVQYRSAPYAVVRYDSEKGPVWDLYRLDVAQPLGPTRAICSFDPMRSTH